MWYLRVLVSSSASEGLLGRILARSQHVLTLLLLMANPDLSRNPSFIELSSHASILGIQLAVV
jgi:hypothetical protein